MRINILSQSDVKRSVNMPQAIEAVKQAFISLARSKAILPIRTQVPVDEYGGITLFMPAYLPEEKSLGTKIVSVFPQNEKENKPTIHAVVIICEAKTGEPSAIMDGTFLTALRTGAVSGLATDLLARQETKTAAIIGAGVQGRTQLEAICWVRKFKKVLVYDQNLQNARIFAEEMKKCGNPIPENIGVADSPGNAVAEADVLCVATTSAEPVFDDAHLKPGVHINGVGSYTPQMQEIPEKTVLRAKVVVDSIAASLEEAGDIIIPIKKGLMDESHILAELGQVASNAVSIRNDEADITLFKSVGLAIQDMAVAGVAFRKAQELGLGAEVEI